MYSSIGVNNNKVNNNIKVTASGKRPKINIKKNNGLIPRGNTLDNRHVQVPQVK